MNISQAFRYADIRIRNAAPEDLLGVAKLVEEISGEGFLIGLETNPTKATTIRMFRHLLKEGNCLLVAAINSRVIGFACAGKTPSDQASTSQALLGLGIKKTFRSQGLGSVLMDMLLNWCKEQAIQAVQLTVLENNAPAISLYAKFGFKTVEIKKATPHQEGRLVSELIMQLKL